MPRYWILRCGFLWRDSVFCGVYRSMRKLVFKLFYLLLFALILEGCGERQGGPSSESRAQGSERQGVLSYETGDAGVTITDCEESTEGEVVIPGEIEGLPVTSIGFEAFDSCSSLTSVSIPESLTSIEPLVFFNCSSLTSITVASSNPAYKSIDGVVHSKDGSRLLICPTGKKGHYTIGENVTRVGATAFWDCSSLTSVTIPASVTSIEFQAFAKCTNLTTITIPDSVTSIGGGAFRDCTSLTSITIPASVTSIEGYAFVACSALTSITMPDSITRINEGAFAACSSLTSITIPEGVTSIEWGAFEDCNGLTSIIIPESVTSIGEAVMAGCRSLTSATIPESVTTIGDFAFAECYSLTSVTIPQAFHSEVEASRLGLDELWPDGFALPDSSSK